MNSVVRLRLLCVDSFFICVIVLWMLNLCVCVLKLIVSGVFMFVGLLVVSEVGLLISCLSRWIGKLLMVF